LLTTDKKEQIKTIGTKSKSQHITSSIFHRAVGSDLKQ